MTVFAAASLTDVFEELVVAFQESHSGVQVRLNTAGSQRLVAQIENGASADVVASAHPALLRRLNRKGLVYARREFATNSMTVVLPKANPASIVRFEDLPHARRIVLADASVPAGIYADQILENANRQFQSTGRHGSFRAEVLSKVVSRESSVRSVLQKVVLGEADAAIVYRTDARRIGKHLEVIKIPDALNVRSVYSLAMLKETDSATLATSFVAWLALPSATHILRASGFGGLEPGPVVRERPSPREVVP